MHLCGVAQEQGRSFGVRVLRWVVGGGGVTRIFRVKAWALAALTTQTQLLVFNMPTTDSNTVNRERQRKGGSSDLQVYL